MNFRLTLVLLILMLVVIAGYLASERWGESPKTPETAIKNPLLSPAPADLASITYEQDGVKQLAFTRENNTWKMTFPVASSVESWQLDDLVTMLKGLSYKEKFQPEPSGVKSAAATGTDHPKNIVSFTDDKGKQYRLNLGDRTVGGIYATLDGSKTIYLLATNPEDTLDTDPSGFRDKSIKTIPDNEITGLTIKQRDHSVTLEKSGEKWVISAPLSARANASAVSDIVNEMKAINATGFAEGIAATGLNPPVLSVTATVSQPPATPASTPATKPASTPATKPASTTVTLDMGYFTSALNKTAVYAKIAGSAEVFTLSADSFKKLDKNLQDLRDPAITPAPVSAATAATVTTNGKVAVKVVKKDGKWMLTSTSTPVPAGDLEVGDWLGDVGNLRAIKFVDDAGNLKSIGLDPPQTRIELTIHGQSRHEVIFIGKPETADKVTPMMRQGEPTVYLVQTADAEKAIPTPLSLRDKAIEQISPDDIHSITIAGKGALNGGTQLMRAGTTWNVKAGGKTVPTDESKMTGLLADFTPLKAAAYLDENTENPSVSGPPEVTVTVTFSAPQPEAPAAAPASTPAKSAATAPGKSAPAAILPKTGIALGPMPAKITTRTLKLYKPSGKETQWKAVWDGPAPQWTFEPTPDMLEHATRDSYVPVPAATQPAVPAPA